jgi:NADPH:quinone reductase-like Zn-dependent oxidoreductase
MKAIILKQFGGVENFEIQDVSIPNPKSDEVLIQVKSIGLNPVDYKTRQGGGIARRIELPAILGWDVSGIITQVGNTVSKFKVGDCVFGMINFPGLGNAYAEYVVASENHLALKPNNISFQEAAALTLAPLTAYQALIKIAKVKKGDRVLVHAAAGGVGHCAVQILKNAGAYVIATASSKNKDFLNSLGVDQFIDYIQQDFTQLVKDVDVVFDGVGGKVGASSVKVLKQGGILFSIPSGVPQDWKQSRPDLITPSFLVTSNSEDMEALASMAISGKLKVKVSQEFPFQEVGQAHLKLESQRTQGKIVLTIN